MAVFACFGFRSVPFVYTYFLPFFPQQTLKIDLRRRSFFLVFAFSKVPVYCTVIPSSLLFFLQHEKIHLPEPIFSAAPQVDEKSTFVDSKSVAGGVKLEFLKKRISRIWP